MEPELTAFPLPFLGGHLSENRGPLCGFLDFFQGKAKGTPTRLRGSMRKIPCQWGAGDQADPSGSRIPGKPPPHVPKHQPFNKQTTRPTHARNRGLFLPPPPPPPRVFFFVFLGKRDGCGCSVQNGSSHIESFTPSHLPDKMGNSPTELPMFRSAGHWSLRCWRSLSSSERSERRVFRKDQTKFSVEGGASSGF